MNPKLSDKESVKLNQALAILLTSTHSKSRNANLIDIAKAFKTALRLLGSYSELSDRIGLSEKMIRQFSSVDRVDKRLLSNIRNREIDSVDAVAHIAQLKPSEQLIVAGALTAKQINTGDIRAIIQIMKRSPRLGINAAIRRVRESRPIRNYVVEFVVRGAPSERKIKNILSQFIQNGIVRIELDGPMGRLILSEVGRDRLKNIAIERKIKLNNVITFAVNGDITP